MIDKNNAFAVSMEGARLLQLEGNCGRVLRRFLQRELELSPQMLHQNFVSMESRPESEFDALCEYAQHIAEQNETFLELGPNLSYVGLVSDSCFGIISNSYAFTLDINTASVAEMKGLIRSMAVLAENLHSYASCPDAAVLDYINRDGVAAAIERRNASIAAAKAKDYSSRMTFY